MREEYSFTTDFTTFERCSDMIILRYRLSIQMMEIISNLIGVLSDKQADVIIATIGFMSAAVVTIIGLFGFTLTIIYR